MRLENYIDTVISKSLFKKMIVSYYQELAGEFKNKSLKIGMLTKANRVSECMSFWIFDKYKKNKILDLKSVRRCKDSFCPNCKRLKVSKSIAKIIKGIEIIKRDYPDAEPIMITLTIPNGKNLKELLDKMKIGVRKFWTWLYVEDKRHYKNNLFDLIGMIRFLEITYNVHTSEYHPHYHILAFASGLHPPDLKKGEIDFEYFRKGQPVKMSEADFFIRKLWTFAYKNKDIRTFEKTLNGFVGSNIVDVRPIDLKGLFEVCKYVFKDNIENYDVFKTLYSALRFRRTIQGYGIFQNVGVDYKEEIEEELILEVLESPEEIYFNSVIELSKSFKDYKKISRFNSHKYISDESIR